MKRLVGGAVTALLISVAVAVSTPNASAAGGHGGGGGGMGQMSGGGFHGGFGGGHIPGGGFHDGFHGGFDGRGGPHFPGHDHQLGNGFHGGFGGQDGGHFGRPDRVHWQAGHWLHQQHNGLLGWWWFVDGDWFLYPDPIYPYPDYDSMTSIDPGLSAMSSDVPPAAVWYYCPNPQGYYPYVSSCDGAWQPVPTVPPMPDRSTPAPSP